TSAGKLFKIRLKNVCLASPKSPEEGFYWQSG
ncbi:MAG: hypothetical protein ACI8QF_004248, partial [Limisphaerales bacterium]